MRDVPSLVLGVDLGTTNTKVALAAVDETGLQVRSVATAATPSPHHLGPALEQLIASACRGEHPEAVGIASMAETGVPLDAEGRPLGDWLRWDRGRPGDDADRLAEQLGWAELVRATGTRPSAKVPLAAWRWLRRTDPDRFAALDRWAGVADLAGLLLTGELATDHTLAARTMAYRRPAPGGRLATAFDADLLAEAGLHPGQLPAVTHGVLGRVASFAGLRRGTPVTIAGHDHAVGTYAAGVRRPGEVADSVGTAEALLTVVASAPDPVAVARAGMSSVVTVDGRHPALLAGSPTAGRFVEWWLAEEGLAPDAFAGDTGAEPEPLLVLPYLRGRQTPAPDPDATVRVVGDARDPEQRARAMLQGLCLQAEWIRREQARLAGLDRFDSMTVLGGPLAANPAWLRRKAAVSGPLRLVREPEAVAAGAALLAAVRADLVDRPGPALGTEAVPPPDPRPDYAPTLAAFVAAATEVPATGDAR
jgi:sugar (pentulose or hexulose) kinase